MATDAIERRRPADLGWWVKQGMVGGVIAGIVFAMFEMAVAALMMGWGAFFMPLRMIGAIALGPSALEASYPLATAAATGLIVHMVLSAVFGLVFAWLARMALRDSGASTLWTAASTYGLALWILNFYLIAPAAGWSWFPERTNMVVQFIAHTLLFGMVLGIYLDKAGRGAVELAREERARRRAA